jgi:serralysin
VINSASTEYLSQLSLCTLADKAVTVRNDDASDELVIVGWAGMNAKRAREHSMSTVFRVVLEGSQEVPPNDSTASGFGTVIFDSSAVAASYSFDTEGIDFGPITSGGTPTDPNDLTNTHFHSQVRGVAGPVVFGQITPNHDDDDRAFILNADGSWSVSGRWETTDPVPITNFSPILGDTFANVLGSATAGDEIPLYFNVHTVQFPGGAIRGQLVAIADDINNVETGTTGNDVLNGTSGNDAILGLTGHDILRGADGDDVLDGGGGNDLLMGGDGEDMLFGSFGTDVLIGGKGDDSMEGGSGSGLLNGGHGNDVLDGGAGIDVLHGGKGDDVLRGGADADFLHGGQGADTYAFASPDDGGDTIVGFRSGTDMIEIDVDDPAMVTFLGFEDSTSEGPAAGAALSYSDRSGELYWDPTGGASDDQVLVARLLGSPELVTSDVLLV